MAVLYARADRDGWRGARGLARRRAGRGGGWEYHWSLLPLRSKEVLLALNSSCEPKATPALVEELADLPIKARTAAMDRLAALEEVEALCSSSPLTKDEAVRSVAASRSVSARTIWNWFRMVEGAHRRDWPAALAPRNARGAKPDVRQPLDERFWDAFYADFMRQAQPSFTACYRRTADVAAREGWDIPAERTFQRRCNEGVPKAAMVLAREGLDALKRLYPAQRRSKTHLHALEWVNGDGRTARRRDRRWSPAKTSSAASC